MVLAVTFAATVKNPGASIETAQKLFIPFDLSRLLVSCPRFEIGPFVRRYVDVSSNRDVLTYCAAERVKKSIYLLRHGGEAQIARRAGRN